MGYTQRAAIERLRVAKAIEEVPELGEAMNQGDLSFSGRASWHASSRPRRRTNGSRPRKTSACARSKRWSRATSRATGRPTRPIRD
jgi:hypothetical protein